MWDRVCSGTPADLAKSPTPSVRELAPEFLKSILLDEPYRSSLHTPVTILGAHFSTSLDLSGSVLSNALSLNDSTFDRIANFGRVEVRGLSCKRCYFRGGAILDGINVKDSVDLEAAHGADIRLNSTRIGLHAILTKGRFRSVFLRDARIEGDLFLIGASTQGDIDADSAHLAGRALLRFGHFANVAFRNTTIGSVLDLSNSTAKKLDLDQIEVGKTVFLLCERNGKCTRGGWQFRDIDLREARIGGDLAFDGASAETVEGYQADIKGDVSLSDGRFKSAAFRSARIGGTLRMSNTYLASLDLTATTIDGDLILERKHDTHAPGALILRNVSVHAIDDQPWNCPAFGKGCEDPWPAGCRDPAPAHGCMRLDLNGFTYSALGVTSRHARQGPVDMSGRDVAWWKGWLSREPYSPQPYERLASVLRETGRPEAAIEIASESKDRERASPDASWDRRAWLLSTGAVIGYGYHPLLAAIWALAVVMIGVGFLEWSGEGATLPTRDEPRLVSEVIYSFDMLIPFVTLRKTDDEIELKGRVRYWFFLQKLLGYALASFLLAWLSGLTK